MDSLVRFRCDGSRVHDLWTPRHFRPKIHYILHLARCRDASKSYKGVPPCPSPSSFSPLPSSFLSTLSCGRRNFNRVVPKYGRHWRKCVNHAGRKYSRRQGRVRTIRRGGARVQKSFFADIRGWELVFYARLRNEFRAFSIPCHATLSIVGRDALFQRWSIEDRGTKTTRFLETNVLIHQFFQSSSDAICLSNLFILLMTQ